MCKIYVRYILCIKISNLSKQNVKFDDNIILIKIIKIIKTKRSSPYTGYTYTIYIYPNISHRNSNLWKYKWSKLVLTAENIFGSLRSVEISLVRLIQL